MDIEITDALLLGFDRTRHYFDGDVFARGDAVSMRVEGYIKDLSNVTDSLSSSILSKTKDRLSESQGESYNAMAGVLAGDIIINDINYGKGRINSISSTSSPDGMEAKVHVGRYQMDIEFVEAISSVNFSIEGDDGGVGDPYKNLEDTLKPYAHRLDQFVENFTFNKNSDGTEDCSHSLQIQYRPAQGQDPMAISKSIARDIYENQRPHFPYVKNLINLDDATDTDIRGNDVFSETYDKVSGKCNFTRTFTRFPLGTGAAGDKNRFKKSYTLNKVATGFLEVVEKCDVLNADADWANSTGAIDIGLKNQLANAYSNCQSKIDELGYAGSTLINVTMEITRYKSKIDNRAGYEVKFSSDPKLSSTGMTIDRKYDVSRDAAGVITVTSEHVGKPLTGKLSSSADLALVKTSIEAGVNNSIIYNYGGTLKTVQESHNRSKYGSRYSIKYINTDDTTIYIDDSSSFFAKKEINVDNSSPVRMTETYTISQFGEIIHVSPQSEVGTLNISFQGQAKRSKTYNPFTNGKIYNQDALINEAANTCMAYFGTVLSPKQLFITDTNYSITSGGDISLDVELQYTKPSLTRLLETRT
jgi:hypothetical protein